MSSEETFAINSISYEATLAVASTVGRKLRGGEIIELIGDLGSGKTAFVRGLAQAIGSRDQVQSPTFTVQRIYRGRKVDIHHYDFHRLTDAGVVGQQLAESLTNPRVVTVIEWGQIVKGVLPTQRLQVAFSATGEETRQLEFKALGTGYQHIIEKLQDDFSH